MMKFNLGSLLGLQGVKLKQFNYNLQSLENKIGKDCSVSAHMMALQYSRSIEALKELGFYDNDVTCSEISGALKNKILGEENLETSNKEIFWQKYKNTVIFCQDDIVSVNKRDVLYYIDNNKRSFKEFRTELKKEIIELFNAKIPNMNKEQIENKIF
jgi:hypothetical protein